MHKIIISDTICFIINTNIGEPDILQKLYYKITTTIEIATEFVEPLPDWVEILSVKDKDSQRLLEMQ
jgi:predicted nucleic acid-binding protein